jgi:hypothetical protein
MHAASHPSRRLARATALAAGASVLLSLASPAALACGERDHPRSRAGGRPAPGSLAPQELDAPHENAPPQQVGRWERVLRWPLTAIHAAVLPTGTVLHYGYPDRGYGGSKAVTWDPATGMFQDTQVSTDIFCSGLSFLADGSLYVTGGNDYYCDDQGRDVTNAFNPYSTLWTPLDRMAVARWYPTNLTLGDGRVLIVSGTDRNCEYTPVMEMYTPGQGLQVIPEGQRRLELYPKMHLLTSGKAAHVGPEALTDIFDPVAKTWTVIGFSNGGYRDSGLGFLVPGKEDEVMIGAGYGPGPTPLATCERINFTDAHPRWRPTASVHHARAMVNGVILPDRKVLLVGGGTDGYYDAPILIPEMYDPDAETWTDMATMTIGRMYHSTAVLLPDGRVLCAGEDDGASAVTAQVYDPPYLFRGARPVITSPVPAVRYGQTFTLTTPQAANIRSVVLIRTSSVTHTLNTDQRYVGLTFSQEGADVLRATAPPDGNHAPPGPYMLFILNGQGVPSVAQIVLLGS